MIQSSNRPLAVVGEAEDDGSAADHADGAGGALPWPSPKAPCRQDPCEWCHEHRECCHWGDSAAWYCDECWAWWIANDLRWRLSLRVVWQRTYPEAAIIQVWQQKGIAIHLCACLVQ